MARSAFRLAGGSLLGTSFCSLIALVGCPSKDPIFDAPGGEGGSGGVIAPCDLQDPDCECVNDAAAPLDVDGDGAGTRLCEVAPGVDCDDGDNAFVTNECGGCNKDLGGTVGTPCGECGVLGCQGDSALACVAPDPVPKMCVGDTLQACVDGSWADEVACSGDTPKCVDSACRQCVPGTTECTTIVNVNDAFKTCLATGSWESSWTSCSLGCDLGTGTCAGLFHTRDRDFGVPHRGDAPAVGPGRPTRDVLDLAVGLGLTSVA